MEERRLRGRMPKLFFHVLRALRDNNNKRGCTIADIVGQIKSRHPSHVPQSKVANIMARRALVRAEKIGVVRSVGDKYKLNLFKKRLLRQIDDRRPMSVAPLVNNIKKKQIPEKKIVKPKTHKTLKKEMDNFMDTVDVGVETEGRKRYNLRQRKKKGLDNITTESTEEIQMFNASASQSDIGRDEAMTVESEPTRRRPTKYMTRAAEKWLEQKDLKNNSTYL